MSSKVADYYNDFVPKQNKVGINSRHRSILLHLIQFGLKPDHNILEIGCGIGTLSKLLSKYAKKGKVTSVDISPDSVAFASKHINRKNIQFLAMDVTEKVPDGKFDFIIMPDVLEHIPLEKHNKAFQNIFNLTTEKSVIAINVPSPQYQQYIKKSRPDLLQIIDEEVEISQVGQIADNYDFRIYAAYPICLFNYQSDYNFIILTNRKHSYNYQTKSKLKMARQELVYKFKLIQKFLFSK